MTQKYSQLFAVVKVDRRIRWHYTTTILRLRIGAQLTRYRNCKFHNGCRTISRHSDGISRYSEPPSAGPLLPLVFNQSDQQKLQSILNLIKSGLTTGFSLNIDKCKPVSYCTQHPVDTGYHNIMDKNQLFPFEKVKSMVDIEVGFDNLTFRDHISEKN